MPTPIRRGGVPTPALVGRIGRSAQQRSHSLGQEIEQFSNAVTQVAETAMKDIRIEGHGLAVEAWRTSQPIKPAIGYGGHPVGSRPKKKALTVWEGRQPFTLTVPLLLWNKGGSVEQERQTIDEMATGTDHTQPLSVKIFGQALPIPPSVLNNWWIEDITWGEEVRREVDWQLILKNVTLTLLERVDDELLAQSTLRTRVAGHAIVRHYTVKKGDTFAKIAATQLNDKTRWADIAVLNGLRSDGQLKKGMVLVLP